jgi:HlyD family secretion protein
VRLNPTIQQNVVTYNVIVDVTNEGNVLKPGMTAQVSFVANQKQDVVRIPNAALRFRPAKDDKRDTKKADAKDAKKEATKEAGKETAKPEGAAAPAVATTPDSSETTKAAGLRRPPSRVYKIGPKNELITVEVRTGIASNQYTELASGEIKPGDELVIRDLQDKNAKK